MSIAEMVNKITELKAQRNKALKDARSIYDKADKEKRSLSGEERQQYDTFMKEVKDLNKDIRSREEMLEETRNLADNQAQEGDNSHQEGSRSGVTDDVAQYRASEQDLETYFRSLGTDFGEARAMQAGDIAAGGALLLPQAVSNNIIQSASPVVAIEQMATIIPIPAGAQGVTIPAFDWDDMDEVDNGTETSAVNEDGSKPFSQRSLTPQWMDKYVLISTQLMRQGGAIAKSLVENGLRMKFNKKCEVDYMVGTGVNQSLGIFTASNDGISINRDVETQASGVWTMDDLFKAKEKLKASYRSRAKWLANPTFFDRTAQFKDANDHYLWEPSTKAGTPDRLLGFGYKESDYAPGTFTGGAYAAALGDFSYYGISKSIELTIWINQYCKEAPKQVRVYGFLMVDGMPMLEEAFVRMKLKA